ncbi:MAG: SMP-30/gluconolactonase/LRE family protein, partial [Opitutus sp.]
VLPLDQMIGAVTLTQRGGLLAALRDGIYLIDPETGAPTLFARAPGHDPSLFRFNDAKVDPSGRLWAGTLALDERPRQSRLYRIDGDGSVTAMVEEVSVSNGLAWTADGRTLYYIDSPTRTVRAFAFEAEHGTLGESKVVITLAETDGWPDGCCIDAEDKLWIGHWGGSQLTRWDPVAGRRLRTIKLPVANVTSCAFGGPKLDHLFITTAVDKSRVQREPEAGFVFCIRPGVTGVDSVRFSGG